MDNFSHDDSEPKTEPSEEEGVEFSQTITVSDEDVAGVYEGFAREQARREQALPLRLELEAAGHAVFEEVYGIPYSEEAYHDTIRNGVTELSEEYDRRTAEEYQQILANHTLGNAASEQENPNSATVESDETTPHISSETVTLLDGTVGYTKEFGSDPDLSTPVISSAREQVIDALKAEYGNSVPISPNEVDELANGLSQSHIEPDQSTLIIAIQEILNLRDIDNNQEESVEISASEFSEILAKTHEVSELGASTPEDTRTHQPEPDNEFSITAFSPKMDL